MKKRKILLLTGLITISLSSLCQNTSQLWNEYKAQEGIETLLPNFSFAGYQNGEEAIPSPKYKIFDVTKFGAIPDDGKSDRIAISKAINAAEKNGSGIIYFPKGKYRILEDSDPQKPLVIRKGNIILRGAGMNETTIFMKNYLIAKDTTKMWTSPSILQFDGSNGKEKFLSKVAQNSKQGAYSVEVENIDDFKSGDWITLRLKDDSATLIKDELGNREPNPTWTDIINNGVQVLERHKIKSIKNNTITFYEPLLKKIDAKYNWYLTSYSHSEECGIEDMTLEGNWKKEFKHHRSWYDDGAWTLLKLGRIANGWISRCRFHNANRAASVSLCSNVSVLDCKVTGTPGHSSIDASSSTRTLMANILDTSSQWHAPGVTHTCIGTVFYHVIYNSNTSFEIHASQPRCTLYDNCQGGFFRGRAGGAIKNLPNHLENLVLWNFKETDKVEKDFDFWPSDNKWWKVVMPIIVNTQGSTASYKTNTIKMYDNRVYSSSEVPSSLYKAQLKLRMGELPHWLNDLDKRFLH